MSSAECIEAPERLLILLGGGGESLVCVSGALLASSPGPRGDPGSGGSLGGGGELASL